MTRRAEDKEIGRLEGQAESFKGRFDRLDTRFDSMEKKFDEWSERVSDQLSKQFLRCNVRIGNLETGQAVSKAKIAVGVFIISVIVSAGVGGGVAWAIGKALGKLP